MRRRDVVLHRLVVDVLVGLEQHGTAAPVVGLHDGDRLGVAEHLDSGVVVPEPGDQHDETSDDGGDADDVQPVPLERADHHDDGRDQEGRDERDGSPHAGLAEVVAGDDTGTGLSERGGGDALVHVQVVLDAVDLALHVVQPADGTAVDRVARHQNGLVPEHHGREVRVAVRLRPGGGCRLVDLVRRLGGGLGLRLAAGVLAPLLERLDGLLGRLGACGVLGHGRLVGDVGGVVLARGGHDGLDGRTDLGVVRAALGDQVGETVAEGLQVVLVGHVGGDDLLGDLAGETRDGVGGGGAERLLEVLAAGGLRHGFLLRFECAPRWSDT